MGQNVGFRYLMCKNKHGHFLSKTIKVKNSISFQRYVHKMFYQIFQNFQATLTAFIHIIAFYTNIGYLKCHGVIIIMHHKKQISNSLEQLRHCSKNNNYFAE